MTRNQDCLIKILQNHGNNLSTSDIIELTSKYPKLCSGCKSGSDVILAGITLLKLGKVQRKVAPGGFRWSLTK